MQLDEMRAGDYAKPDATTAQTADSIRANAAQNGTSLLRAISDYVKSLPHDTTGKAEIFRKRTASEIIRSGFQTGCTDRGVVFLTLAQELGIPAFYVETFKRDSLHTAQAGMQGHVFTKIYDAQSDQWKIYEPVSGFQAGYTLGTDAYVPVAIGRDHSAAYRVNERGEPAASPQRLDSEAALKAMAAPTRADGQAWASALGERVGRNIC